MATLEEKWALTRETVGSGRLSIVMPLYKLANEASDNLHQVAELFERHRIETELVPVDDGSGDGTDEILARFTLNGFSHVTLKPVICPRNGGKGAALRAGFEASSGRYVMLLDGDLDINPKQTPLFFEEMVKKGVDIVVGSKRHRKSSVQYPWHRRIVSWCYFTLVRIFVGLPITDTQTGMKLFKREVLGPALDRMLVKTYAFDLELLAIAVSRGATISEAPVVIRFGNKFGALKSKTVWQMSKDTLAVFYRLRLLKYYAKCLVPKKLDHEPLVSVVIACPKGSWMLDECLKAIRDQSYSKWECIVLPDGEIEPSAVPSDPRIRFIPTGKVRPAEKRNVGIREAKGEIVAFIDDDAYPESHWLEYAIKYFGEPDIGGVGGPGVTPPGDTRLARIGGRVYDNLLVSGNYRYRYHAGGVRMDVDDYPSCNLFIRKDVLDTIGGYRTDFWPGEDTLLCKDVIDNWKRIIYDPWVVVYHHRRPLFLPHLRQLGRYAFHRGYFCKRFPSNSLHLSYFVPTLFDLYVALLAVIGILNLTGVECLRVTFHRWGGYCPLWIYLFLVAVTSFSLKPHHWFLTAAGVIASHVWYGVRFIQGLCARRAPCEYIGKDHAVTGNGERGTGNREQGTGNREQGTGNGEQGTGNREQMNSVIWIIGAYLIGGIPFGYLIGRMRGIDVRTVGSKNIGATNVFRTVGKKWGLLAFACDVSKGLVPTAVAKGLLADSDPSWLPLAVGVTCVVGHMLTPYMKFRGGKGVATAFGMMIALVPALVGVAFAIFSLTFACSHFISLGSCVASLFLAVAVWFPVLGTRGAADFPQAVLVTLIALFIVYKHRSNIGRLVRGTESKIYLFGKKK